MVTVPGSTIQTSLPVHPETEESVDHPKTVDRGENSMKSTIGREAGYFGRDSQRGSSVYSFLGILIIVVVVIGTIFFFPWGEISGRPDSTLIDAKNALKDQQWEKAITLYGKVIKENPDNAAAHLGRSVAYVNTGNFSTALNDAAEAVKQAPNNALAYGQKALVEKLLGQNDDALRDLTKAVSLEAGYAWALAERADIYSRKNEQEKALEDANKALKVAPKFVDAYRVRAWIYSRMGKCSDAAKDFETVAKLKPNDARTIQDRAWFLLTCPDERVQNQGKAFELAKEAMKLTEGKDAVALETLAEAYFRQADAPKAVQLQKQAITLKSQSCPSGSCTEEMKERLKKYEMAARKETRKNYEILPLDSSFKP
jgi:tetratricopeptide (TPR) repeat protein